MTRNSIDLLKDKGPGDVCDLADNLAVHEVAKTDETSRRSCGDSDVIENGPNAEFGLADIEPKGNHQAQCATMRGKAGITRQFPTSISHKMDG